MTVSDRGNHKGWYRHRFLPHVDAPSLVQHICFHLADSLPSTAIDALRWRLRLLPPERRKRAFSRGLHDLLDRGVGCCLLRQPRLAQVVEDSLRFGDGSRYELLAWVIMPNHVHVLVQLFDGWPLGKVVQSWKRHTTRQIKRMLAERQLDAPERIWHDEYWDRFVRDHQHLETVIGYIEQNPVRAGLVESAKQWPSGSARFRLLCRSPSE